MTDERLPSCELSLRMIFGSTDVLQFHDNLSQLYAFNCRIVLIFHKQVIAASECGTFEFLDGFSLTEKSFFFSRKFPNAELSLGIFASRICLHWK